jgi:hypothetical protein
MDALYSSVPVGGASAKQHALNVIVSRVLVLEPALAGVELGDTKLADPHQRFDGEPLPSYRSTVVQFAWHSLRSLALAMTVGQATVLAVVYVQEVLVNTETEAHFETVGPSMENIVREPVQGDQSNYVSGYPKEEIHCYDCHSHFQVAVSNRYYS